MKFVNAKPVYFPPMERKWANDNGGSMAYKTAAIRDHDGSFGGGPESYVLINDGVHDSIAVDTEACEIKPTWNAAVCKGDVGRMNIGGGGGGRGAGGGRGGARGGAAVAGGPGAGGGGALAVLAQPAVLALARWRPPEVVVALAAEEEPEALVDLRSRQSFSAAMARTTP